MASGKKSGRVSIEEPISCLYQSGYGTELDVFQISKEQYQLILESKDTDLVDEWDLIDEGAHSYADDIDLYLNGKKITLTNSSLESERGPLVEKVDEQITETGKFYFIRAWENKGTWGGCSFKGKFDESKLHIKEIVVKIGNEVNGLEINFFDFQYESEEDNSYDQNSYGKGMEAFLVDDQGNVTEI